MDELWKVVLREHRDAIVNSADPHDVFLDYLIDYLLSKRCIQHDQSQLVKREPILRARISKLLDFVFSEGRKAFEELCNAFDEFGTEEKKELAKSFRRSLREKKNIVSDLINQDPRVAAVIQAMKKERDALKDELLQLTTKYDAELMKLQKEMIDVKAERDAAVQQLASSGKERDAVGDQLSKITAECDTSLVERLLREKEELIEINEKQVKQLEVLKDAVQQTKSGLGFITAPCNVKLIHSMNEAKAIFGLVTLNSALYVRHQGSSDITVYDTETYSVQRSLRVGLPRRVDGDMTSCKRHQCIYIADPVNNVVHRVDNENTLTQWPVNDQPHGLSVNSVYNVLVTCDKVGKVKEFTTDGKLIREISLESSIVHPWHTVELTTGQLVVCHGDGKDALHRVCIVDLSGRVLQSYGGSKGSGIGQLNVPIRLAVNGVIFVAELNNNRVLMLSPTLSLIREVLSGLRYPSRIWMDDETGRLYVGDNTWENNKWVSGQVKVYGV